MRPHTFVFARNRCGDGPRQDFFGRYFKARPMAIRNTDDLQISWGPKFRHDLIQLKPGRATARQAKVAICLAFYALEQPGYVGIVGFPGAPVSNALEPTLHGKAHATRALRGNTITTPHAAVAAVQLVVILAGLAGPGPYTA